MLNFASLILPLLTCKQEDIPFFKFKIQFLNFSCCKIIFFIELYWGFIIMQLKPIHVRVS